MPLSLSLHHCLFAGDMTSWIPIQLPSPLSQSCLDPPLWCTFHLSYCLVPMDSRAQDTSHALLHFVTLVAITFPTFSSPKRTTHSLLFRTRAEEPFLKLKSLNLKAVHYPLHSNDLWDAWVWFRKFAKCTLAVFPSIFATRLSPTNSHLYLKVLELTLDWCPSS